MQDSLDEQVKLEERTQAAEAGLAEAERKLAAEASLLEAERKLAAEASRVETERKLAAEASLAEAERKLAAAHAKLADTEQRLAEIAFSEGFTGSPRALHSPAAEPSRADALNRHVAQTAPPRLPLLGRGPAQLADVAIALDARCALNPTALSAWRV